MSSAAEAPRFLVTGAAGMLGQALTARLSWLGLPAHGADVADFDLTDATAVLDALGAFREHGGEWVLNAAAYTDVERAEDERETAYAVNERAPRYLAETCVSVGLGLAHVSTDFVFSGEKDDPYDETDVPDPLSVYGASKLAGEGAVFSAMPDALIVRTAWLFGEGRDNFPSKILAAARAGKRLRVVAEEIGSPTYAADLAAGIVSLTQTGARGLFHLANAGSCSRCELAVETLRLAGIGLPVEPVSAGEFPSKAARPRNSVLDCSKAAALGVALPEWRDALARYVR